MAYSNRGQIRTAFGQPLSSSANQSSGLVWMIGLVVGGGLLAGQFATNSVEPLLGTASRSFSVMLGAERPERVRHGAPPVDKETRASPVAPAVPDEAPSAPATAPVNASEPAVEQLASPSAAAIPDLAGTEAQVGNTDGVGVVLRTAPRPEARVPRGLMEGTRVTVLERAGDEWARVRAANGQEGWVPLQYLKQSTPGTPPR